MRDFTPRIYRFLLEELQQKGYTFQTFEEFLTKPDKRVVILRHDVDARKNHALRFAQIEQSYGIRGSYYFRILPQSYNPATIDQIKELGHEIGYHYEDLTLAKGNITEAIQLFENHLALFRKHYPVKTICMHGSPLSKFDNRKLWEHFHYKDYGIIGEPYFDIDFNTMGYLTDTGRTWNNEKLSVRDKVDASRDHKFTSTRNIIHHIDQLPDRIMFTLHPQRWNDAIVPWLKELIFQNMKNVVKRYVFVKTKRG